MMLEEMTQPPMAEEGGREEPGFSESLLVATELEEKFGRQAFADFIEALIPPAWARQQAEHNIEALFAWLDGETVYPDLGLALGDVTERVEAEEGQEAVRRLLARLAPCEPGEVFWTEGEFFPRCRPPDPELDRVMEELLPALREELPRDLSFRDAWERGEVEPEAKKDLGAIQRLYRFFVLGTWLVGLACLILLGLILLLAARGLEQVLLWSGWPFLVAGVLGLVGMTITFVSVPFLVQRPLDQLSIDAPMSPVLLELGGSLLTGLARGAAGRGLVLAGGLTLLGLVALIGAAVVRRAREG
jgi:hypothetical protein